MPSRWAACVLPLPLIAQSREENEVHRRRLAKQRAARLRGEMPEDEEERRKRKKKVRLAGRV